MSDKIKMTLALAIILGALAMVSWAQSVPQLINYQGRLTDGSGQPLTDGATVDLTFSFYGAELGGTPLFLTVLQEDVAVNKGIYNVLIGSGSITPGSESTLAFVFQNHADVWMGVKADADPEMTPRSRISAVPYAMSVDVNAVYAAVCSKPDQDGDGYMSALIGGDDCHDGDPSINPGANETCDDGWDNDCNGYVDKDDYTCKLSTWMSGSTVTSQFGVYGTKGVADAANAPGSRYAPVSWIDGSGNMWLFGGVGFSASGAGNLNDMWRWDGTNWTWMSGSTIADQHGVYGTKGVPDAANCPGGRSQAVTWVDGSGNAWLFGGNGYGQSSSGYLNDLWRWDGTSWTWMSGSTINTQCGVYGTKGVADAANVPGVRYYSLSWIDGSDNLWLFGGAGYGQSYVGYLNDLWKWDGAYWTWISGNNYPDQNGVYGTKGTPDAANVPGGRNQAVSWLDGSGNMWLFGGYGLCATGTTRYYLNDLWRWDGTNWTWMSGSSAGNQSGVYGAKGFPHYNNAPGSRMGAAAWGGGQSSMMLFGGMGYDESAIPGYLNDLWRWDGTNWTWMSGSDVRNQYGVYGTKGDPDSANAPGGRYMPVSWIDGSGNMWLFGGTGYAASGCTSYLNDLWRYE